MLTPFKVPKKGDPQREAIQHTSGGAENAGTPAGNSKEVTRLTQFKTESFSDPSLKALELPFIYFAWFIALATLSLMVGLYLTISFATAAQCVLGCLFAAAIPLRHHVKMIWREGRAGRIDFGFVAAATLVASAGGFLAASINRPDIDDSIYVPKAVFYLANPDRPLDLTITWLAGLPRPVEALDLQYYETIQAALAKLFGVHFLSVYHIAFPFIAAFLMSISMLLFFSVFERRKWACLAGLMFLLLVLLSLGETHMAFGNLSLARAFHGKYVFLSTVVPAWSYFSLQFLIMRKISSWAALVAIAIGMVGIAPTALVFLPLLSGLITAAYLLSTSQHFNRSALITAFAYFLTLTPVMLGAINYLLIAKERVGTGSVINVGWPVDFFGQLRFLIEPSMPLTPFLAVASVIALCWYSRYRLFFAWWIGLAVVLLLNPIVSGYVMRYIAPESIYWRLFYLIPFPLIAGVAFVAALSDTRQARRYAAILTVVICVLGFFGPTSIIRSANNAQIQWPGYKIEPTTLSVVKEIVAVAPEGSMLAPIDIASNVLIYTAAHPQYYMRDDYLRFILYSFGLEDEFENRAAAFKFLYDGEQTGRSAFEALLSAPEHPRLIVLNSRAMRNPDIGPMLTTHGYRDRLLQSPEFALYESSSVSDRQTLSLDGQSSAVERQP